MKVNFSPTQRTFSTTQNQNKPSFGKAINIKPLSPSDSTSWLLQQYQKMKNNPNLTQKKIEEINLKISELMKELGLKLFI